MKWDYKNNLPVKGTYRPRGIEWDEFFLEGKHHSIPEEDVIPTLDHVIFDLVRSGAVSPEIEDFCLDHLNGVITLLNYGESHWRGREEIITDADIYARLYFCDTENDIFDIVLDGAGDATSLLETFGYEEPDDVSDYTTPRNTASEDRLERFEAYLSAHDYPKEGNVIWERFEHGFFPGRLLRLTPREMKVSFTRSISMADIESKPLILPEQTTEVFATKKGADYVLTEFGRRQMNVLFHRIVEEEYFLYSHPECISFPGPALAMDLTPELQNRMSNTIKRLSEHHG